jgi:(5-formylfuran-3-yl)methyl phosphate synthase
MRLLVSVRSAAEVEPALAGGADIIDAKEPDRGSLGPVSAQTLAEILGRLPPTGALSVALGDVANEADLVTAIGSLSMPVRPAPTFLKLGFAGVTSPEPVFRLLATAVQMGTQQPSAPLIIAVAYADAQRAGAMSPELITRSAHRAGAAGVLIDTYLKDGKGLLEWLSPAALGIWVSDVRRAGLLSAVAGALGPDDLDRVRAAAPDVIGFRGAACDGGRSGGVSAERVATLRRCLEQAKWVVRPVPERDVAERLTVGEPGLAEQR